METVESTARLNTELPAQLAWLESPEAIREEVHKRLASTKSIAVNLSMRLDELDDLVEDNDAVQGLVRKALPLCQRLLNLHGGLPNDEQMAELAEFYMMAGPEKVQRMREEAKLPRVLTDVQIFEKLALLIPANEQLLAALLAVSDGIPADEDHPDGIEDPEFAIGQLHQIVWDCENLKATYEISWCALRLARAGS